MCRSLPSSLQLSLRVLSLVVTVIFLAHRLCCADLSSPEYHWQPPIGEEYNLEWLFNISRMQERKKIVRDAYVLPPIVEMNPSFLREPTNDSNVVIIWRIIDKSGKFDKVGYMSYDMNSNEKLGAVDWIGTTDRSLHLFYFISFYDVNHE